MVMNNKTFYNIPLKSIPFYVMNINQYNIIYNNEFYIINIIWLLHLINILHIQLKVIFFFSKTLISNLISLIQYLSPFYNIKLDMIHYHSKLSIVTMIHLVLLYYSYFIHSYSISISIYYSTFQVYLFY